MATTTARRTAGEVLTDRLSPPALPARRRPAMIALALVLICTGILGGAWLLDRQGENVEVLTVTSHLQRGQSVGPADLSTVTLPADTIGLTTVAAGDLDQIVGQTATTELWPGSLLSPQDILPTLRPEGGMSLVGVALTDAQRPAQEIVAGDHVRIIATPQSQGEVSLEEPQAYDATVSSVALTDSGLTVVNVMVPSEAAPALAANAATERIALVLDPAVD